MSNHQQVTLHLTPEDSAEIKLHCTITFAGEDVIGGVQDIVSGVISSPLFEVSENMKNSSLLCNKFVFIC